MAAFVYLYDKGRTGNNSGGQAEDAVGTVMNNNDVFLLIYIRHSSLNAEGNRGHDGRDAWCKFKDNEFWKVVGCKQFRCLQEDLLL